MVIPTTEIDVLNTLELIRLTTVKIEGKIDGVAPSEFNQERFDLIEEYLDKIILYCNEIKHYCAPDDNDNSLELSQWQIDDIPF